MDYKFNMLCVPLFLMYLAGSLIFVGGSPIGVCYGMEVDKLPSPKEVVTLYKTYRIGRMRLYEPNHELFHHLIGSGIEILVGIKNEDIELFASSSLAAREWVNKNIRPYWPRVRFRYIAVGNEVIPGKTSHRVLPAMKNINDALENLMLSEHIKVSTVVTTSVINLSSKPSAAAFLFNPGKYMKPIAQYLSSKNAPLLANIHPYFIILKKKNIPLKYALFRSSEKVVRDGSFEYLNLFDELVDSYYVSLAKAGAHNVTVVVSETGWSPVGDVSISSPILAETYYRNVIHHILSSNGTPRWNGTIETYLYSLFHENKIRLTSRKRQCGLFHTNKKPIYNINFK